MPIPSRCPRCAATLPAEANFPTCPACGTTLSASPTAASPGAWWLAPPTAPPSKPAPVSAPTATGAWWLSSPGAPQPPEPLPTPAPSLPAYDHLPLPVPVPTPRPAPIAAAQYAPPPEPISAPPYAPPEPIATPRYGPPEPCAPHTYNPLPAPRPVEPRPRPGAAQPSFLPLVLLAGGVGGLFLILLMVGVVVMIFSPEKPVEHANAGAQGPAQPANPPQGPIGPPPTTPAPAKAPRKGGKGSPPKEIDKGGRPKVETPAPKPVAWVLPPVLEARLRHSDFKAARGLTADLRGTVYVSDGDRLWKIQGDRRPAVFLKDIPGCNGLALSVKGELLACLGNTGRVVRIDVDAPAAGAVPLGSKRFNNPRSLAVHRGGGLYLTDAPPFGSPDDRGAVHYIAPSGTITRLDIDLPRPRGVALAPDGRTVYVVGVGSPDLMAYPLEAPGSPGRGRSLCRLEARSGSGQGGMDVAVDERGHLFVMSPALPGVRVFSPGGESLATLTLPEAPVACALGGEGRRTLFVLTRRALYSVEIAVPR